jgi:hypothetical protein
MNLKKNLMKVFSANFIGLIAVGKNSISESKKSNKDGYGQSLYQHIVSDPFISGIRSGIL